MAPVETPCASKSSDSAAQPQAQTRSHLIVPRRVASMLYFMLKMRHAYSAFDLKLALPVLLYDFCHGGHRCGDPPDGIRTVDD